MDCERSGHPSWLTGPKTVLLLLIAGSACTGNIQNPGGGTTSSTGGGSGPGSMGTGGSRFGQHDRVRDGGRRGLGWNTGVWWHRVRLGGRDDRLGRLGRRRPGRQRLAWSQPDSPPVERRVRRDDRVAAGRHHGVLVDVPGRHGGQWLREQQRRPGRRARARRAIYARRRADLGQGGPERRYDARLQAVDRRDLHQRLHHALRSARVAPPAEQRREDGSPQRLSGWARRLRRDDGRAASAAGLSRVAELPVSSRGRASPSRESRTAHSRRGRSLRACPISLPVPCRTTSCSRPHRPTV